MKSVNFIMEAYLGEVVDLQNAVWWNPIGRRWIEVNPLDGTAVHVSNPVGSTVISDVHVREGISNSTRPISRTSS